MSSDYTPDEINLWYREHIENKGWTKFLNKDKPKAKISYGKKGKRKSILVKK